MGRRGKFVLLLVVVGSILYVLISPLPEQAATNTLNFPVLPLLVAILLQFLWNPMLASNVRVTDVSLNDDLSSRNCVLLC